MRIAVEKEKKSLYVTATRAKREYFLTDAMIKMIGEEDKTSPNPHYRSSGPMRLYLIERIEKWVAENADLVDKSRGRREKLSKAQLKIHAEKREKMKELAASWKPKIYLRGIAIDEVAKKAGSYYYFRYDDFDGEVTRQGLIAYIRHEYTDYEDFLSKINDNKGKTGVGLLYLPLRTKADEMISKYLDKKAPNL